MPTTDPKISANVICDSVNTFGNRLTTMVITYPRIILAEVNTHRAFCLAGDTELIFDLPAGTTGSEYKNYKLTIKEFYEKWNNGAKEHSVPNRLYNDNLDKIAPNCYYYPEEICAIMGLKNPTNINALARSNKVIAFKEPGTKRWCINGESFIDYRKSKETRTHSLRSRLKEMRIRQWNESENKIQHSTVNDVFKSEPKDLFNLSAGGNSIRASKDHLFLTQRGWVKLSDIVCNEDSVYCMTQKLTRDNNKSDRTLLTRSLSGWCRSIKQSVIDRQSGKCNSCGCAISSMYCDIHHIVPVGENCTLAFKDSNVEGLCPKCHIDKHRIQGWQTGNPLTASLEKVDSIEFDSIQETYDLSIAGDYPNFFANEIVVHNSKSTASSRAIPVVKQIEKVKTYPFIPSWIGKNQAGMQANEEVDDETKKEFKSEWLRSADMMIGVVSFMTGEGIHKQIANRLLEPWQYVTTIISGTDWANFFKLRCNLNAQPEFMALAFKMLEAYVESKPVETTLHIPFGHQMEPGLTEHERVLVACARCARISYETHDGKRDAKIDIELSKKLIKDGHMSPFEHVAYAHPYSDVYVGNFQGWIQHRKKITKECCRKLDYKKLLKEKPDWV